MNHVIANHAPGGTANRNASPMPSQRAAMMKKFQAFSQKSFPKRCSSCGRLYSDLDGFLRNTRVRQGQNSGFMKMLGLGDAPVMDMVGTCRCGSTLMVVTPDRRDQSDRGRRRRRLFDRMVANLVIRGLAPDHARERVLHRFRHGRS